MERFSCKYVRYIIRKYLTFIAAFGLFLSLCAQTTTFTPTSIAFSAPEILNPARGFFRWNSEEVAPYPSIDRYERYKWSDIETAKGVYNFTVLEMEAQKAKYDVDGRGKFSFGIRCVVSGDNKSYPTYLGGLMTAWYSGANACWVPDWNDPDFLERVDSLMANLGRKFNKDPRIGYIEIRTYGNWGEWHMSGFETEPPGRPEGILDITTTSIQRMIDAHIKAFPNKQIIMMSDNNIGLSYALTKTGLDYPIGWRRDSWCYDPTFSQIKSKSAWTTGGGSIRWKTAPVILEGYRGERMSSKSGYQEVIEYHGSAIGNGNFISAWNLTTQGFKDTMLLCAKTSGYRFIIRSVSHPTTIYPGQTTNFSAKWSNVGVATLYENRQVIYRISNIVTGSIIWQGISTINLRGFLPTIVVATQVDTPQTVNDTFQIPTGLLQGTYNLDVIVSDPTAYYTPLNLAITGRKADGAYPLGTINIAIPTQIDQPECAEQLINLQSVSKASLCLNVAKSGVYSVKIYSAVGSCLFSLHNANFGEGAHYVDINNLKQGVYLVNVYTKAGEYIFRFVKN